MVVPFYVCSSNIFVGGGATATSEDKVFWPQFLKYFTSCSVVRRAPRCFAFFRHSFHKPASIHRPLRICYNTSKGFPLNSVGQNFMPTGMSFILIYSGDDLVGGCWDRSNESGCEWSSTRRPSQAIRGNCFPCVAIFYPAPQILPGSTGFFLHYMGLYKEQFHTVCGPSSF